MGNPVRNKKKKAEETQLENADAIDMDLRVREGATVVVSSIINDFAPTQDSPAIVGDATTLLVNVVMSDYKGGLEKDQILAKNDDKLFLPQPGMLAHWSEDKNFQQLKPKDNKLSPEDVAGKYVLTYYPPIPKSWAKRTTENIADTSNKHWYSHCKSTIYDDHGKPVASVNPEAAYNDVTHDATVYVPEDSYSYVIDYQALGLSKEDITEGFKLQSQGINVMSPDVQKTIFKLKAGGKNTDEIIAIMKKDNKYHYNLQDNSCAIQPTAPVLYATAAKISREKLNEAEASALRKNVGLYNIYDEQKYGKLNEEFYDNYKKRVFDNFTDAVKDEVKQIVTHPVDSATTMTHNAIGAARWGDAKIRQWAPRAMEILYTKADNAKKAIKHELKEDAKKARDYLSSLGNGARKVFTKIAAPILPAKTKKKPKNAPRSAASELHSSFVNSYNNAKRWVSRKAEQLAPGAVNFYHTTKENVKKRMKNDAKRARDYLSSFSLGKKVISYIMPDEPTPPRNTKRR